QARRTRTSRILALKDSPICKDSHRTQPHIQIGECDPEQAAPRPFHVIPVQAAYAVVTRSSEQRLFQFVLATPDQMPHRIAAQCISAQHDDVYGENNRSNTEAEQKSAGSRIREPQAPPETRGRKYE